MTFSDLFAFVLAFSTLFAARVGCANSVSGIGENTKTGIKTEIKTGFKSWLNRMEKRGIRLSVGLWDLPTGKIIEGHQTDLALIPASTTKIVSSYAILKVCKPNTEIETEIFGDQQGSTIKGDLIFKGSGDPFIVSERIWMLAQTLKEKGIDRISGRLRFDQSAFDKVFYEKGWGNTSSDTTPPIMPFAVNFSRDTLGRISHEPEKIAMETITRIFFEAGITVDGGPSSGGNVKKITAITSPPMRQLVMDVNKFSNNFMIEMLVKRFGDGSWPKGVARINDFYESTFKLGKDKIVLTDGSGLSKDNRLSARTLSIVLRSAFYDFEVGPEFVSSLKIIGGEPWKLKFKDENLARRIRCKTGHLSQVSSVCGYMQAINGEQRVFAIILNGNCHENDLWDLVSLWAN